MKQMKEEEKILISMGYRLISPNVWGKPVGYHLFTYETHRNEFTNWMKGINDGILRWNSDIYEADETVENDFLKFLKYVECVTNTDHRSESTFDFVSVAEQCQYLM